MIEARVSPTKEAHSRSQVTSGFVVTDREHYATKPFSTMQDALAHIEWHNSRGGRPGLRVYPEGQIPPKEKEDIASYPAEDGTGTIIFNYKDGTKTLIPNEDGEKELRGVVQQP